MGSVYEVRTQGEAQPARLAPEELIAMVQHEASNALQRIMRNTSRLRRAGEFSNDSFEAEDWRHSVREIEVEAKDLGRLLNVLPEISAGLPVELEPVVLQRVLPQIVLERWRGGRLHAEMSGLPPDLPPVLTNPELVRIVLHNLLANAEKYAFDQPVEISACSHGGSVALHVRDYGPGLHPEDLESIFDFFFRGRAHQGRVPGMGVGLSLCRLLMTSMGGRIYAELPPGGGLQVTLLLPALDEA